MSARCVLPSRTLPNLASMLYGVDPSVHGVHDNTGDGLTDLPSLLQVLAAGQRRSAMFYGWAPLRWLDPTDTRDHDGFEDVLDDPETDLLIAGSAGKYIRTEQPISYLSTLAASTMPVMTTDGCRLVISNRCDTSTARWLSSSGHCLRGPTCCVSQIMAVTVTTTRWGRTEVDVVIPFLMWGKGVVSGCGIESAVTTLSVAPTLARLLGVSALRRRRVGWSTKPSMATPRGSGEKARSKTPA